MVTCRTLTVLFVLGAFLTACRTTDVPANEGVIPILEGTPFYDDFPGTEQAWWGTIGPGLGSEARYELGVHDFPRNLPMDEGGNVDLEGGERSAELEPFAQVYASVIIYGKAALTTPEIPGGSYGTLYVGEIGAIEGGRIGCDPRHIPEAERAGAVVVGGNCNHYLEVPEPEETYRGVLRVGERGPPPPPDRRHYPYFLDTEGGQIVRSRRGDAGAGAAGWARSEGGRQAYRGQGRQGASPGTLGRCSANGIVPP